MSRIVFHVTYDKQEGRWKVARGGEETVLACYGRDVENPKEAAIKKAVALARKNLGAGGLSQVVIYNRSGKIHSERTYGYDLREIRS